MTTDTTWRFGKYLALPALALVLMTTVWADETQYLSPLAVAAHGETLYVTEFTANQIAVVDATTNQVTQTIAVSNAPSGVAISSDGQWLYATVGGPEGHVLEIEAKTGNVVATLPAGHTPTAPVLHPDGKSLFVCNRFSNDVSVFDLTSNETVKRIPVTREPFAAAITPDGSRLFITNLIPAGSADADYVAAIVDVIDTVTLEPMASIRLPNGSTGLHGICISPDGRYAYVTHILARYQLPTTQLERGWINTNAVSVIDAGANTLVNTFLLDDVDLGAANPWGIACTADGKWLCVAHSGADELSVIDREALHGRLDGAVSAGTADTVPNDLAFLVNMRQRHKLKGKGPRGIVFIESRVYLAEYFSGSLGVVKIDEERPGAIQSVALGDEPAITVARAGEMFFHDATVCFQQWQSCASCHPGDARVDALNWDLLNDGMGNPKNNKSLLLSHETPPAMITGIRDTAEVAVRAGIRHILFNVLPEEHAVSVDEYLKSLKPVPSPWLEQGALTPAAQRGQEVFESARCSRCHPAPLFTDMKQHDVGTGTGREENARFDTPTLVEVWRTAPYFYDGRASTIEGMLTTFNADDRHGHTSTLSEQQLDDLITYVLSL
jgi:YVTN family beta-propeller protein